MSRRLSELLALVERRTITEPNERDDGAPRRLAESVVPTAPARAAPALEDDGTGTAMITLRVDTQMLARVDADARRLGISRTAWLHLAAGELLGDRR